MRVIITDENNGRETRPGSVIDLQKREERRKKQEEEKKQLSLSKKISVTSETSGNDVEMIDVEKITKKFHK